MQQKLSLSIRTSITPRSFFSICGALVLGTSAMLMAGCSSDSSDDANLFEVTIENISNDGSAVASNGAPVPVVFSPAVAAVHSTVTTPFFVLGAPTPSNGLEAYAEDADPGTLLQQLAFADGVSLIGLANESQQTQSASVLLPGQSYRLVLSSENESDRLSLILGYLQSNDVVAANLDGIALYDGAGAPITADVTSTLSYLDVGAEVNQEPGLGADQPPRQADVNTGQAEGGAVRGVDDGFNYPAIGSVLRVTVKSIGQTGL